jgi:hypothetical protein
MGKDDEGWYKELMKNQNTRSNAIKVVEVMVRCREHLNANK